MEPALFDFEEESPHTPAQMSGRLYSNLSAKPSAATAQSHVKESLNMAEGHMFQQPASAGVMSSSPPFGPGGNVSPLQRFVKAKGKINAIYEEIHTYVNDVTRFLNNLATSELKAETLKMNMTSSLNNKKSSSLSVSSKGDSDTFGVVEPEFVSRSENYVRQVDAIRQILSRDHMKVVFFGRTSNGKSTLINAMLGDRILPTGIGHTTSCFLQVEGGDEQDPFLLTDEEEDTAVSLIFLLWGTNDQIKCAKIIC